MTSHIENTCKKRGTEGKEIDRNEPGKKKKAEKKPVFPWTYVF